MHWNWKLSECWSWEKERKIGEPIPFKSSKTWIPALHSRPTFEHSEHGSGEGARCMELGRAPAPQPLQQWWTGSPRLQDHIQETGVAKVVKAWKTCMHTYLLKYKLQAWAVAQINIWSIFMDLLLKITGPIHFVHLLVWIIHLTNCNNYNLYNTLLLLFSRVKSKETVRNSWTVLKVIWGHKYHHNH